MKTYTQKDNNTGDLMITHRISSAEIIQDVMPKLFEEVIKQLAEAISEAYVKEHAQEIISKIDQNAIVTMVVAQSGNAIKDMLDKKLPDKVVVEKEVEVYQRGILGGITRIK